MESQSSIDYKQVFYWALLTAVIAAASAFFAGFAAGLAALAGAPDPVGFAAFWTVIGLAVSFGQLILLDQDSTISWKWGAYGGIGWIAGAIAELVFRAFIGGSAYPVFGVVGGAVAGLVGGVLQQRLLRGRFGQTGRWAAVSAFGWSLAWFVGALTLPTQANFWVNSSYPSYFLLGLIGGAISGGCMAWIAAQEVVATSEDAIALYRTPEPERAPGPISAGLSTIIERIQAAPRWLQALVAILMVSAFVDGVAILLFRRYGLLPANFADFTVDHWTLLGIVSLISLLLCTAPTVNLPYRRGGTSRRSRW